jgi:hypothetical protein
MQITADRRDYDCWMSEGYDVKPDLRGLEASVRCLAHHVPLRHKPDAFGFSGSLPNFASG